MQSTWCGIGHPPHDRQMLASAFVAKTVLGIKATVGLLERLRIDKALGRICGFPMRKKLPSEASFSSAFAVFAEANLAECAYKSLVKAHLGDALIGHISRDATAIEAREKPKKMDSTGKSAAADLIEAAETAEAATIVVTPEVKDVASKANEPSDVDPVKTDDTVKSRAGRKKKSHSAPPPPKWIEVQFATNAATDAGRDTEGLRPGQQVQRARIQEQLERL